MEKSKTKKVEALVVGAGFSGLYLTYRFQQRGVNVLTIEAGDGVGGTWYWNRYPGARVDVLSVEYSYSFSKELQEEWNWTEKYSPQPELLEYLNYVADKFDLRKNIELNTRVTDAIYNEEKNTWSITTDKGDNIEANYFILATGCLSVPRTPNFKGMENFKGEFYHTGEWPKTPVDFTNKKVAVIGTGSSGIQAIPVIAETAKHVTVFQRDANYTVPSDNAPLSEDYLKSIRANYAKIRKEERYSPIGVALNKQGTGKSILEFSKKEAYEILDDYLTEGLSFAGTFSDVAYNVEADKVVTDYLHERIAKIVKDPKTAVALRPKDSHYTDRRPCMDTHYYETYNRDNVTLVDVYEKPIVEITERGIRTSDAEYGDFDMIVCATGYDAMTGAINKINIIGRNEESLRDKWSAGPRMYLGLMSHGFPNMFAVTGPGSPSVLSNMVPSIEQDVEWIDDCLKYMKEHNLSVIEAELEAEDNWVQHCSDIAEPLFISKGNSWYVGANIPGKPRVFMPYVGGVGAYKKKCEEVVKNGYEGFMLYNVD